MQIGNFKDGTQDLQSGLKIMTKEIALSTVCKYLVQTTFTFLFPASMQPFTVVFIWQLQGVEYKGIITLLKGVILNQNHHSVKEESNFMSDSELSRRDCRDVKPKPLPGTDQLLPPSIFTIPDLPFAIHKPTLPSSASSTAGCVCHIILLVSSPSHTAPFALSIVRPFI